MYVNSSNLIITIWLLPVGRLLWSCEWTQWFWRMSKVRQQWKLSLPSAAGQGLDYSAQRKSNRPGATMKYQVLPPLLSPRWFVALQGRRGDKSASEPDSFTTGSFLSASISPKEEALWRMRWPRERPVCVVDMSQGSTLIRLRWAKVDGSSERCQDEIWHWPATFWLNFLHVCCRIWRQ